MQMYSNTYCVLKCGLMDVTYKNKETRRSKLYLQRIGDLLAAETLETVRHLPGRYHELKENRKGRWACDLDQPYRLIFEPHEKPIPTNPDGQYLWIEIKGVEILEIDDYHGK